MIFHCSPSDSKSPNVSRTLGNFADINIAVV